MVRRASALALALSAITVLAGCMSPAEPPTEAVAPDVAPALIAEAAGQGGLAVREAATLPIPNGTLPEGLLTPVGTVSYTGLEGFEPTLGVDAAGNVFFSNMGPINDPAYSLISRSTDKGVTWTDVTPRAGGLVTTHVASFDPYVHVDVDTGRVFLNDLQALACAVLSFSDDQGATWITNPLGCGQPVGVHDHQTVFTGKPRALVTAGYDNVVYYCINRVVGAGPVGATQCAASLNGGISFGPLLPVDFGGCGGLNGHGTTDAEGRVYIATVCDQLPILSVSEDNGLTWTPHSISDKIKTRDHEVSLAVDENNTVYAFWISDDRLPYLAASADYGATWSEPVMVAPAGINTAEFPTVAAGAPGRVAFAYYGTSTLALEGDDNLTENTTWTAYIGTITNALDEVPVIKTAAVTDPTVNPLGRAACTRNTRCGPSVSLGVVAASRGVGDFIDIVIDSEGRPWVALVDGCVAECDTTPGPDNNGTLALVGTLTTGPRLRGEEGVLEPLPVMPSQA